jgi:transposase-like protein
MMHATKIPVRTWVLVIFEMCASKNGVSAREVGRKYGLTPRSAWHLTHRIRSAMAGSDSFMATMKGTVVADETFIGGSMKNMHRSKIRPVKVVPGDPYGSDSMTPVLTLIDKGTRVARSRVVPNVTGATLRKAISEQVDMGQTTLHTDSALSYTTFSTDLAGHESVNHTAGEYVRGDVSPNQVEGFFSQLKRSLDGTHHDVSREHLHRYLSEYDFRYSTCKMTDEARMRLLATQMEGRLTLNRVTA